MRPARKGPENPSPAADVRPGPTRFNEAGPQGAGKPLDILSFSAASAMLQ